MMTKQTQTTPTKAYLPWAVKDTPDGPLIRSSEGSRVAEVYHESDAALIVTACNNHARLVEALCAALPFVEDALDSEDFKPGYVKGRAAMIREVLAQLRISTSPSTPNFNRPPGQNNQNERD